MDLYLRVRICMHKCMYICACVGAHRKYPDKIVLSPMYTQQPCSLHVWLFAVILFLFYTVHTFYANNSCVNARLSPTNDCDIVTWDVSIYNTICKPPKIPRKSTIRSSWFISPLLCQCLRLHASASNAQYSHMLLSTGKHQGQGCTPSGFRQLFAAADMEPSAYCESAVKPWFTVSTSQRLQLNPDLVTVIWPVYWDPSFQSMSPPRKARVY